MNESWLLNLSVCTLLLLPVAAPLHASPSTDLREELRKGRQLQERTGPLIEQATDTFLNNCRMFSNDSANLPNVVSFHARVMNRHATLQDPPTSNHADLLANAEQRIAGAQDRISFLKGVIKKELDVLSKTRRLLDLFKKDTNRLEELLNTAQEEDAKVQMEILREKARAIGKGLMDIESAQNEFSKVSIDSELWTAFKTDTLVLVGHGLHARQFWPGKVKPGQWPKSF